MSRTNIELNDKLVKEGLKLSGLQTKRELVEVALERFVRKQKLKSFLTLQGRVSWEGDLHKMRRDRTRKI